jgi:hypothetical protein
MSVLLYVVGALAAVAGAAAILFGIPVKEFSFGDTLIVSGTVSLIGGLIVVGLAAAVSQLQRLSEMAGARPLSRSGRAVDVLEAVRGSRAPFPPKSKPETTRAPVSELPPFVPAPTEERPLAEEEEPAAPSIRNPDLPPPGEEPAQEAPVLKPVASAPSPFRFPERPKAAPPPAPKAEPLPRAASSFESSLPPWRKPAPAPAEPRAQSQPSYFDAMWKNEPRTASSPSAAETEPPRTRAAEPFQWPEPEPALDPKPAEFESGPEPTESTPPAEEAPRAVAVLKSGVVDGMGYTLYVDGSIEAELPNGTLRFASINELRAHLERNP